MLFNDTGFQLQFDAAEETIYSCDQLEKFLRLATDDPSDQAVKAAIDRYFDPASAFRLFFVMQEYDLTGLIGIMFRTQVDVQICHICVDPDLRWKGIGKLMLEALSSKFELRSVTTCADEISAGFFEACGFRLEKIKEHLYENDQFRCTKLIAS